MEKKACLQQICLAKSDKSKVIAPKHVEASVRTGEKLQLESHLLRQYPRDSWPNLYRAACPHPVLLHPQHYRNIETLHVALVLAITNIVERWWTDTEARFFDRMPLEPHEEDLLRWMSTEAIDEIRPFKECLGSWRPDILIENASDTSEVAERFVLCEINARFSFNGFILSSSGQQALQDMGSEDKCMLSVLEPSEVVDSLLNCFDPTRPLHLLKGEEHGHDIHLFVHDVERRTRAAPIFISPEDLRLVPTDSSKFGYKLCSTVKEESPQSRGSSQNSTMTKAWRSARFIYGGEILEEVHQVGLELHQRELRKLSPEMLRHLALRCFNDMRTIFLVHDKRMLGILLQELDSLVTNHGVLTKEQARTLREGIVTTYLPGSQELEHMIVKSKYQPELKNNYILKPIRSGKGAGIIFGDEISNSEWQDKLETLRRPDITLGQPIYIVQRQINQPTYQVLAREEDGLQQNRLVGTYLAIHGKFLGLGIWRCGPGRICAVSRGGAVIFSVLSSAHRIETPRRSCTSSKPLGWLRSLGSWVKTQLACSAKNIK